MIILCNKMRRRNKNEPRRNVSNDDEHVKFKMQQNNNIALQRDFNKNNNNQKKSMMKQKWFEWNVKWYGSSCNLCIARTQNQKSNLNCKL